MEVHLVSTSKIVMLVIDGVDVPARLWEGRTESGIPVDAYITRISASLSADLSQFEAELEATRAPSAAGIPLRLIL